MSDRKVTPRLRASCDGLLNAALLSVRCDIPEPYLVTFESTVALSYCEPWDKTRVPVTERCLVHLQTLAEVVEDEQGDEHIAHRDD